MKIREKIRRDQEIDPAFYPIKMLYCFVSFKTPPIEASEVAINFSGI